MAIAKFDQLLHPCRHLMCHRVASPGDNSHLLSFDMDSGNDCERWVLVRRPLRRPCRSPETLPAPPHQMSLGSSIGQNDGFAWVLSSSLDKLHRDLIWKGRCQERSTRSLLADLISSPLSKSRSCPERYIARVIPTVQRRSPRTKTGESDLRGLVMAPDTPALTTNRSGRTNGRLLACAYVSVGQRGSFALSTLSIRSSCRSGTLPPFVCPNIRLPLALIP